MVVIVTASTPLRTDRRVKSPVGDGPRGGGGRGDPHLVKDENHVTLGFRPGRQAVDGVLEDLVTAAVPGGGQALGEELQVFRTQQRSCGEKHLEHRTPGGRSIALEQTPRTQPHGGGAYH